MEKNIVAIAGYKFIPLTNLESLKETLQATSVAAGVKGTILLSKEGINVNLAGNQKQCDTMLDYFKQDKKFNDIVFKTTYGTTTPYTRMLTKIKDEIITFKLPAIDPAKHTARHLPPKTLKKWLDEGKDITLLDARNAYEVAFGTFDNAIYCDISKFNAMPEVEDALHKLDKNKPTVTFCTGGVRCEKSSVHLEQLGFTDVYQIKGGILGYFAECGGAHYHGDCFVFDKRIAVNPEGKETDVIQCRMCRYPVTKAQQASKDYVDGVSCPRCVVRN